MTVLFFATARAATGRSQEELPVSGALSEGELWEKLIARHPALAEIRTSTRLARNGVYAEVGSVFSEADEVALIPPVSGG